MKERNEAIALAGLGLVKGLGEEFGHLRQADKAWLGITAGVSVYELFCKREELLSEGYDRYIDKHPVITRVGTLAVAAHLCNLIPNKYDPIHQASLVARKFTKG